MSKSIRVLFVAAAVLYESTCIRLCKLPPVDAYSMDAARNDEADRTALSWCPMLLHLAAEATGQLSRTGMTRSVAGERRPAQTVSRLVQEPAAAGASDRLTGQERGSPSRLGHYGVAPLPIPVVLYRQVQCRSSGPEGLSSPPPQGCRDAVPINRRPGSHRSG